MHTTLLLTLLTGCSTEPAGEELTRLSSREQLIRLSVDLRGVHPSETELQYLSLIHI